MGPIKSHSAYPKTYKSIYFSLFSCKILTLDTGSQLHTLQMYFNKLKTDSNGTGSDFIKPEVTCFEPEVTFL